MNWIYDNNTKSGPHYDGPNFTAFRLLLDPTLRPCSIEQAAWICNASIHTSDCMYSRRFSVERRVAGKPGAHTFSTVDHKRPEYMQLYRLADVMQHNIEAHHRARNKHKEVL